MSLFSINLNIYFSQKLFIYLLLHIFHYFVLYSRTFAPVQMLKTHDARSR